MVAFEASILLVDFKLLQSFCGNVQDEPTVRRRSDLQSIESYDPHSSV